MDNLTASQRAHAMRSVKSANTSAELAVRGLCRALGEPSYRLHRKDLPGKPDIAYVGRRLAVFVHGCFWHGHDCKAGAKKPRTNAQYWQRKIERNCERDSRHIDALMKLGWKTLVIWECEMRQVSAVEAKLARFLMR